MTRGRPRNGKRRPQDERGRCAQGKFRLVLTPVILWGLKENLVTEEKTASEILTTKFAFAK